ncbi:helix-turn-helix domain-containing protein [Halobacteriovorax marinus]|uniref:helix-turn-helix domain-containing protein n=1 Tax=Halobacteriovorax marinus TaxID=97084 RepID=UPI003A8DF304
MKRSNFTQIPNELIRDPNLDPKAKALYMYLASLNPCFPSYKSIMEALGIKGKSTVKKLIDILIDNGWADYISGGFNKPNIYKVHWSKKCTVASPENGPITVQKVDSNNTNINTKPSLDDELEERMKCNLQVLKN